MRIGHMRIGHMRIGHMRIGQLPPVEFEARMQKGARK
jgi:hypothetical protein